MCVCMRESEELEEGGREGERERGRERDSERERERERGFIEYV